MEPCEDTYAHFVYDVRMYIVCLFFFCQICQALVIHMLANDNNTRFCMHIEQDFEYHKEGFGMMYQTHCNLYCTAEGPKVYLPQTGEVVPPELVFSTCIKMTST